MVVMLWMRGRPYFRGNGSVHAIYGNFLLRAMVLKGSARCNCEGRCRHVEDIKGLEGLLRNVYSEILITVRRNVRDLSLIEALQESKSLP